jgi:hypothetical protein
MESLIDKCFVTSFCNIGRVGDIASSVVNRAFLSIFRQDICLKPVRLGITTENLLQSSNVPVNVKFPKETSHWKKKHN